MRQAIGFFDSGIGGLSVLRAAQQALPRELFIYVADCKYAPYGEKSTDFIQNRSLIIGQFLVSKNVKAIVVACNTATAHAIQLLRARYPRSIIIGVEPAILPALEQTKSQQIAVLATPQTIESAKYQNLVSKHASHNATIHSVSCPGLVNAIESNDMTDDNMRQLIQSFIKPIARYPIDQVILGCTHYAYVKDLIADVFDGKPYIHTTEIAVVKQMIGRLEKDDLLESSTNLDCNKTLYYANAKKELLQGIIGSNVRIREFER